MNRSDTKAEKQTADSLQSDADTEKSFFKQSEMFGRASTSRSMTIKLKTMKTTDLDIGDSVAQDFLSSMYGDTGTASSDSTRTKITTQQKCKYCVHMFLVIFVPLFIFWYIPIHGNIQLYDTVTCHNSLVKYYGCKDFHANPYLQGFYALCCLYLLLSALQIKWGFPIFKKPSSVMQYNNTYENPIPLIGLNIYIAIPFLIELRCLLDFTFSKTSLDIFQFWQLF